jgi:shikimate dehydrogenase
LFDLLGREPGGERVALLGAGGAAAAALAAMEMWTVQPNHVSIHNRSPERASGLLARFGIGGTVADSPHEAVRHATLVINATSVGFSGDETPVDASFLPRNAALLDLVYRKGATRLVREARALGIRAADGRVMLLEQGALAFTQWFGYAPNKTVMRNALERAIMEG